MEYYCFDEIRIILTIDVFVVHLLVALEYVALRLIWPVDFNAGASSLFSSINWIELSSELLVFFKILLLQKA